MLTTTTHWRAVPLWRLDARRSPHVRQNRSGNLWGEDSPLGEERRRQAHVRPRLHHWTVGATRSTATRLVRSNFP